jgi:hypothetical protein
MSLQAAIVVHSAWPQLGKDFMHTAPFSCTAHLACLNVHLSPYARCRSSRT